LGIGNDAGTIGSLAAVNTSLAAATGAVSALFSNLYLEERRTGDYSFNLTCALNGVLSGLVAITASCGLVEPWAACVIGIVAGWLYLGTSALLLRWKIDDAVDAIPVHLFNGAWGLVAVGLFASPRYMKLAMGFDDHFGFFYSVGAAGGMDVTLLMSQLVGLLFCCGWPSLMVTPFFIWLNYIGWLRADSLEELVGLDMSYHGGRKAMLVDDDDINEEDLQAFEDRRNSRHTYDFDDDDDDDSEDMEQSRD